MNSNKLKFRYGTMKRVAEHLGISHQAAIQRIYRGDVKALEVALDIEEAEAKKESALQKRMAKRAQ